MIALQTLLSLAFLLAIVLVLYNKYRVDLLRQELFEVRDALFDEAASGQISFDSRAYEATRFLLNGMLRFGHELSLARFLVALSVLRARHFQYSGAQFEQALNASPAHEREICAKYVVAANKVVARHLLRSPFALPLLVPVVSCVLTLMGVSLATKMVSGLKVNFRALDRAAYAEGMAD